MKVSYKKSGVDYGLLDPVKRLGQVAGLATVNNIKGTGFKELRASRGETAYILEGPDAYYVLVEEGLGTKNLVADEMRKITGKTYYDVIAQDTVAAIVNDLITAGARPLTVLAYWAVGDSEWLSDKERVKDLVGGWKKACDVAGCTWGGGETPSMKGVVYTSTINLAGAAFGVIRPKERIILGDKLKVGDIIILFESNGVHANGLSLARKIINKMPKRYGIRLSNNKMYGEELLRPSIIYSKLIEELMSNRVDIHYMVNITGHGWRKLMRARKSFSYVVDNVPPVPELFNFIQRYSGLSDKEMYETFNMGAGFAAIVDENYAKKVLNIARRHKIKVWVGGYLEKGAKQVHIRPKNIVYKAEDLKIR